MRVPIFEETSDADCRALLHSENTRLKQRKCKGNVTFGNARYLFNASICMVQELWAQFDTKGEGRIKLQSLIEFLLERRRLLTRPISQREIQSLLEALDMYVRTLVLR